MDNADAYLKRDDTLSATKASDLRKLKVATLCYVVAQAADSATTAYNAHKYGIGVETNPVVRGFMQHFGIEQGLALQGVAVSGAVIPFCYKNKTILRLKAHNYLLAFSALHLAAAAMNTYQASMS